MARAFSAYDVLFSFSRAAGTGPDMQHPKVDGLMLKIRGETDRAKRNAMIKEAFDLHSVDIGHIPLHQQALVCAMKNGIDLTQLPNNYMPYRWVTVK